jgi:cytidylate kinase
MLSVRAFAAEGKRPTFNAQRSIFNDRDLNVVVIALARVMCFSTRL